MSKREYQACIDALGLSQVGAAELVGIDPRTSRRFSRGEYDVPQPIALLLRVMVKHKVTAESAQALLTEVVL